MILFDEVNDYYSIADTADLTFPNGDWCVGFWARIDDNTGTIAQYALSTGAIAAGNLNIFLVEASSATDPNQWSVVLGATVINGTVATPADGVNRLIVVQRSGSTVNLYSCVKNGSVQNHLSNSLTTALDGGAWNIGRRTDGQSARYYGSHMGELFLIHGSTLSSEQIKALADGLPVWALGKTLKMYLPMTSAEATLNDLAGTYNATRVDAPTTSEHVQIGVARVDRVLVAASGGVTGTGSLTAAATTASGTGTLSHTGTGALTTQSTTLEGAGIISRTGTGSLTAAAVTASGAGTLSHTGTGSLSVGATTLSGTGTAGSGSVTGTGSLTIASVTASGTGALTHTGTGAATVCNVTASGTGALTHTGTGAATIGTTTLSGSGIAGVIGTGAITVGNVTLSGAGTYSGWHDTSDPSGTWSEAANASDIWTQSAAAGGTWTAQ